MTDREDVDLRLGHPGFAGSEHPLAREENMEGSEERVPAISVSDARNKIAEAMRQVDGIDDVAEIDDNEIGARIAGEPFAVTVEAM